MGMTIDNAISAIEMVQTQLEITNQPRSIALDTAIDTMRKYQKIADLYDYWRSSKCEYTISCMENIGKVLRDGNDN